MPKYDVIAVMKKTGTIQKELDELEEITLVESAKRGQRTVSWSSKHGSFKAELWVREVIADHVPGVLRAVRKTIGPNSEIIHLELVKEVAV
jgi:hypothetical protein